MTKTAFIAAILASLAPAAASALSLQNNIDAASAPFSEAEYAEIEAKAKAAAEEAMKPENVERRRNEDQTIVDNAMRQLAISSDNLIAEKLPMPDFAGLDAMQAVLQHPNAWEKYSARYHENEELIDAMTGLSMHAGSLLYYEWACDTGRMANTAGQYIDIIDTLVTAYPERIFLSNALGIRKALGYPSSKGCNREYLNKNRADFQKSLSAVLEKTSTN